jgi:energy-converting hydrogenase A subunit M
MQEKMRELKDIIKLDDEQLLIKKIEEIVPTYKRSVGESVANDEVE